MTFSVASALGVAGKGRDVNQPAPVAAASNVAQAAALKTEAPDNDPWAWLEQLPFAFLSLANAITQLLKIVHVQLNDQVHILQQVNEAQGYAIPWRPTGDTSKDQPFKLGGDNPSAGTLDKLNRFADLLHSLGLGQDFPEGYAKDNKVRVTAGNRSIKPSQYETMKQGLDNLGQRAQTMSNRLGATAEGNEKSTNSAVEFSSGSIKLIASIKKAIAGNLR